MEYFSFVFLTLILGFDVISQELKKNKNQLLLIIVSFLLKLNHYN